jgi:hypothetical protein
MCRKIGPAICSGRACGRFEHHCIYFPLTPSLEGLQHGAAAVWLCVVSCFRSLQESRKNVEFQFCFLCFTMLQHLQEKFPYFYAAVENLLWCVRCAALTVV